jgi:hypothetical protein
LKGLVERFNRTFKDLLSNFIFLNPNTNWFDAYDHVMNIYNNNYHATIKNTPTTVLSKSIPNFSNDDTEEIKTKKLLVCQNFRIEIRNNNIKKSVNNEKNRIKKKKKIQILKVGDIIAFKCKKDRKFGDLLFNLTASIVDIKKNNTFRVKNKLIKKIKK